MNSTEVTFVIEPYSENISDLLMAELGNIGYEGFSYTDNGFQAYIPAKDFNAPAIDQLEVLSFLAENYRITYTYREIADQDWNKVWEENFTPIVVDNRILVRAGFHAPLPGTSHRNNRKTKEFIFLIISYLHIPYFLHFCPILPIFCYSVHF